MTTIGMFIWTAGDVFGACFWAAILATLILWGIWSLACDAAKSIGQWWKEAMATRPTLNEALKRGWEFVAWPFLLLVLLVLLIVFGLCCWPLTLTGGFEIPMREEEE